MVKAPPTTGIAPSRAGDLAALAVIALALRLAMAWAIPLASGSPDPSCAPDEPSHLAMARALSRGHAPTWPDGTSSVYGAFLPTPYVAQALTLALAGAHAEVGRFRPVEGWAAGYEAARAGSALLGVLTVLALALAAGTWTGSRGAALAVGLAAALYPQLVFVGAYTNADAFTLCAGAWHAWAVLRWARAGEGAEGLAAVGATAGLVVLGKLSGYYLLPVTAAWVGWALLARRIPAAAARSALATMAIVCVPILVWNAFRTGGDVLGTARYRQFLVEVWRPAGGRDGRHVPDAAQRFASLLPRSAFGVLRNMDLFMPAVFYRVALSAACAGLAAGAWLLRRASPPSRRAAAWLVGGIAANLLLVAYNCWFVDFSPQGRYVLLSALLVAGVAVWAPARALPRPLGTVWPAACLAFLVACAAQAQVLVFKHPCLPR